jgi:hypothetical protein
MRELTPPAAVPWKEVDRAKPRDFADGAHRHHARGARRVPDTGE